MPVLAVLIVLVLVPLETAVVSSPAYATLTVKSVNARGNPISGMGVELSGSNGYLLADGQTPVTFSRLPTSQQYLVHALGSGSCQFDHWFDNRTAGDSRPLLLHAGNNTLYAVYSGTCP